MIIDYQGRKYDMDKKHHRGFLVGMLEQRLRKGNKAFQDALKSMDTQLIAPIKEARDRLTALIDKIKELPKI